MTATAPDIDVAPLQTLIRQLPGVTALYRSPDGPLHRLATSVVAEASRRPVDGAPLVRVENVDGGLTITVVIGTGEAPATTTCRLVHDTIAQWCREQGVRPTTIRITIAQVRDQVPVRHEAAAAHLI